MEDLPTSLMNVETSACTQGTEFFPKDFIAEYSPPPVDVLDHQHCTVATKCTHSAATECAFISGNEIVIKCMVIDCATDER